MLTWYPHLYVGETVAPRQGETVRRLDDGDLVPDIFLITLSVNPSDQLDIVPSLNLIQKTVRERLPMVVGLAGSRREALDLVVTITDEAVRADGEPDLRRYLSEKT